jgi:hypothetical protein
MRIIKARIALIGIGAALALALTACGGSADETTPDTASPDVSTTTGGTVDTPTTTAGSETTTTAASEGGSSDISADHPRTDVSHATVVVGDEVFYFAQVDENGALDPNGDCDPEFFGSVFRAILRRVDAQGDNVEMEDTGDLVGFQGATFSFTAQLEEGIVAIPGQWQAFPAQGFGSVDSLTIDGDTATGTATFVDTEGGGDTASGEFEVTCVS